MGVAHKLSIARRGRRLDWTIVRPTIVINGPQTKAYRVLVDPRDWTTGFKAALIPRIAMESVNELRVSAARSRRRSSVGRTRWEVRPARGYGIFR